MAGGSLPINVPAKSKYTVAVESPTNAFPVVVAWLEHMKPNLQPKPSKTISVSQALMWSPTPTAPPELFAWRNNLIVTNETSAVQSLTLHWAQSDGRPDDGITLGEPVTHSLEG